MEQKIKYQYTYYIHPYVIEEKEYKNYMYELLKKEKCQVRFFDSKKDVSIDSYFLPEVKDFLFWSFSTTQKGKKEFETMDKQMQATILSQYQCNIFEYEMKKDIPGKTGEKDGIFFDILKIELICFKNGICFLLLKTAINSDSDFSDLLNFQYKFRMISSEMFNEKEYEKIKIQTDNFKNMLELTELIQNLKGRTTKNTKINLDENQFYIYAYTCLNHTTCTNAIEKEFEKYRQVLPASEQLEDVKIEEESHTKYGFSPVTSVLLTTDENIKNYTKLPFIYENEYLYDYIFHLYQKISMKLINQKLNETNEFLSVKEEFLTFTKKVWIEEVTNKEDGKELEKNWKKAMQLEEKFMQLKTKYDLFYKEKNVSKTIQSAKIIGLLLGGLVVLNIIILWLIFGGK